MKAKKGGKEKIRPRINTMCWWRQDAAVSLRLKG